jgi:carbamoyl-phosphate synthase small subunit
MHCKLILKDGTEFEAESFGAPLSAAGEVVFATGMTGYPESLTDPSYAGQILVFTYPLIGNYGVPDKRFWESTKIHATAVVVSSYNATPSHFESEQTLASWLNQEKIPGIEVKDTRLLTKKLRQQGVMLGKIVFKKQPIDFYDPNKINLVAKASTKRVTIIGKGKETAVLMDCGAKKNIARELAARGLRVITVPWNYDIFKRKLKFKYLVLSNGPGDPKMASETVTIVQQAMDKKIPILGICLGNQILALAAGGDTYKLKFGHRGQNQPAKMVGSERCYLTTQNHGFAVKKVPKGFRPWFVNANDNTNEGIIHNRMPWMSVQFHPESTPGPWDTAWIFDYFLKKAGRKP